jgi:hypothetical protein
MFTDSDNLEAVAIVFPTWISNGKDPDFLVAGADVRHVDAELFQTAFQCFDSEILCV